MRPTWKESFMASNLTTSEALMMNRLRLAEEEAEKPVPLGSESARKELDEFNLGPEERGDD
jgi:hypothetical protein